MDKDADNEQVPRPEGRDSKRNIKIAVVLVLVLFFGVVLYLYQEQAGGSGTNASQNILDTEEAREWISSCEIENFYIKHKCPDLFYYEYALKNSNEGMCGFISDGQLRKDCMVYFKLT